MTNSDNAFGTFNKQTKLINQPYDGSTALTTFANVDAAKAFFFTDEALTVMNECCTVLAWELITDSRGDKTGLKTTFAFGTKGTPGLAGEDDWAEQYNSRKQQLLDTEPLKWTKTDQCVFTDSSDHLV